MEFDAGKVLEMAWQVVGAVLAVAVPVATIYVQRWGSAFVARKRLELTDEQNAQIDKVISFCVSTAEQLKINGLLPDGTAAKEWVIDQATRELKKYNIPVDIGQLSDRIEGNYHNWLSDGVPDKQFLVDRAIDVGVAAYQDSGTGDEVKKLITEFSKKYLAEFGITVNASVLEGLALSKLNSLK